MFANEAVMPNRAWMDPDVVGIMKDLESWSSKSIRKLL